MFSHLKTIREEGRPKAWPYDIMPPYDRRLTSENPQPFTSDLQPNSLEKSQLASLATLRHRLMIKYLHFMFCGAWTHSIPLGECHTCVSAAIQHPMPTADIGSNLSRLSE